MINLNWKRFYKPRQEEVVGLDIGSSSIKLVQLRKNTSGYSVIAAGIIDFDNGTDDDKAAEETNIVKAISDCMQSTGIRTRLAVCNVAGPEVAVRNFKFPLLPPEEVESAVMLEASQVCPFNIADGTLDYRLLQNGRNNTCGIFVAATNKLIERKKQLAENASLRCVLMDVDGLAILNCFSAYEKCKAGQATAILNIGNSNTNLAIISDNGLPFVRDLPYAGRHIIEKIAADHSVQAETITRILSGRNGTEQSHLELGESLAKACEKLIADVTDTLRYYASQEKADLVEKILVCGGFASTKGLLEMLGSKLPEEVVLWNPFDKMECDSGKPCQDILRKRGYEMAVAAGLAMRSI